MEEIDCLVINQIDRLRFLRTPLGSAVLNDTSHHLHQSIQDRLTHIHIGSFLRVTMRRSDRSMSWAKMNPFTVLTYQRIPPPHGVSVYGSGKMIRIECKTRFSTIQRNEMGQKCSIFSTSFIDAIYDINQCVDPDLLSDDCVYLMELRIDKIRQRAGEELIVSRLIQIFPINHESRMRSDERISDNLPSSNRYEDPNHHPDMTEKDHFSRDHQFKQKSSLQEEVEANFGPNPQRDQEKIMDRNEDPREIKSRETFYRLWRNEDLQSIISTHAPKDLLEAIHQKIKNDNTLK